MKSRHYSTSTSDIKLWVRRELLLWWAPNRTWQKSLSSWWSLMERFGTWSDEPKATEPSQLSSQTPGFQDPLSDGRPPPSDPRSCTASRPSPRLRSCLRLLLSSQWLTSTLLSSGNHQTVFPLVAQSTSKCHKVRSSDVQQYCCCRCFLLFFLEKEETVLLQRNLGIYCTNNRNCHKATTCYWGQQLSHLTNDIPKLIDYFSVLLFWFSRENVQSFTEVEDFYCTLKECIWISQCWKTWILWVQKRETSLLGASSGSLCVCVLVFLRGVCRCLSVRYKPDDHHRWNYGYWFI